MRRMGITWALALVSAFAACADDDTPIFEADPIYDEEAVPAALSTAQCEAQMACECLTPAGPVGEDPEAYALEQCKEHRRLELEFWQKGARHHGLTYDPTCLARRVEAMDELGCADHAAWSVIEASGTCADRCRIYHGDLAEGADCELTEGVDHCGQGLFCDWSWDETISDYTGTCKPSCVADGESCLFAGCGPGSHCVEWVCQPMPSVGDACPDYWCLGGICNPDTLVCEAYLSPGDDCASKPGFCNWGCLDGVCQAGPAFVCGWDFRQPYGQYY